MFAWLKRRKSQPPEPWWQKIINDALKEAPVETGSSEPILLPLKAQLIFKDPERGIRPITELVDFGLVELPVNRSIRLEFTEFVASVSNGIYFEFGACWLIPEGFKRYVDYEQLPARAGASVRITYNLKLNFSNLTQDPVPIVTRGVNHYVQRR